MDGVVVTLGIKCSEDMGFECRVDTIRCWMGEGVRGGGEKLSSRFWDQKVSWPIVPSVLQNHLKWQNLYVSLNSLIIHNSYTIAILR